MTALNPEKGTRARSLLGGIARKERAIWVVLVLYLALAATYSMVTPIMEASDELWHYPMVKFIADHGALPVQDPENVGPWRQEGSQAPLYYVLSAGLTFWIDTSDMDQVRWLNPLADNGIIREDGNTNLIVHTKAETWPWRGTVLAVHLIRLLSACMGAGTVYLTYRLALELWADRALVATAAAAITAFNPMFLFISGAVNNDNLAMLLCALAIWLLVRAVKRHAAVSSPVNSWWADMAILGVVLGAAVLTKSQSMGLLPLTALAIAYIAWRRRSWPHLAVGGATTAALVLAVSGWWFARNAVLYDGDWTGIERFVEILGYRVPPATLRQLWGERHGFMMAYWGLFGGVNVPLPQWIYAALNGGLAISVCGLVLGAVYRTIRGPVKWTALASERAVQFALVALWPAVVFALWAVWALRTWSSQGRLVFGAISAWSLWMALGLCLLAPRKGSAIVPGALATFMLVVAAWAPLGVIGPAYRPPVLADGVAGEPGNVLRADVGGQVRLLGYDIERTEALPGQAIRFSLTWEAQQRMDRNWTIFCHLVDLDTELHVATRDRYPGQGLLATSLMEPGLRWVDEYVIELPNTVYAPSRLAIEIGLYDGDERPPIVIEQGSAAVVSNGLRFEVLQVTPHSGEVPNATRVNFEDRMALVGWQVEPRVVMAGATVELVLYWQGLERMQESFTVSTQLVSRDHRKAAQEDLVPGGVDTTTWSVGQQVVDRRALRVAQDAPPGGYDILLGVYRWETPQELERLRVIDGQGRVLPRDSVVLGQIRIAP